VKLEESLVIPSRLSYRSSWRTCIYTRSVYLSLALSLSLSLCVFTRVRALTYVIGGEKNKSRRESTGTLSNWPLHAPPTPARERSKGLFPVPSILVEAHASARTSVNRSGVKHEEGIKIERIVYNLGA
jgi:hypothetical protein